MLLYKEEGSSPVSLQLLRGGIGACMRCPVVVVDTHLHAFCGECNVISLYVLSCSVNGCLFCVLHV